MSVIPHDTAVDDLAKDLEQAGAQLTSVDTPFHRRMYVRALFAWLEGFGFMTRQFLLAIEEAQVARGQPIDWERHTLFHEDELLIEENGRTSRRRRRVPFKDHFAFSIKAFAQLAGCSETIFSDNGWNQLRQALLVRDRITHPKRAADVVVSDEDLTACREGYAWFASLIVVKFKDASKKQYGHS